MNPAVENLVQVTSVAVLPDATPAVISVTVPSEGQHFAQGENVSSAFTCNDGAGNGVAACVAPGKLDTATAGTKTFVVNALDNSNNRSTATVSYVVDPAPGGGGGTDPGTTPGGKLPVTTPPTTTPTKTISMTPTVVGKFKSTGSGLSFRLRCTAKCTGRASLFTKRRGRRISVGAVSYSVPAGKTGKVVKVKLNRDGKGFLRSRGSLKVSVEIIPDGRAKATLKRSATVRRR